MPTLNLTDRAVKALRPKATRIDYWDEVLQGFVLRIAPSGTKNYSVIYRTASGRRGRFPIGDATLVSLADARAKARKVLIEVENGGDPSERRRDERTAETFAQLTNEYLEIHCRPRLKPRSVADIEYTLRSELLPAWGHRKANDISRADVVALIEKIGVKRNAPVRANHVRAVVTGIFTFAMQREYVTTSPCAGLPKKYDETPRKRVLTDEEIQAFWKATETDSPILRDLMRMLLLLGQRSGETRQMRWDQLDETTWTIPAEVTKNGQEHRVPLSKHAIAILKARENDSALVFPSRTGKPFKWLNKLKERLGENLELDTQWQWHDLRRTCATGLEKLGFSSAIIGAVLNHTKISQSGVTGRYTHHTFELEKRKALDAWGNYVHKLVAGGKVTKRDAEVVTFARRG